MTKVIVLSAVAVALLSLAMSAEACDWACGDGCCCPFNCTNCTYTEFKCWDIGAGGTMSNCINVGSHCPWSGCAGFSCFGLRTIQPVKVVSVEIGTPIQLPVQQLTADALGGASGNPAGDARALQQ